MAESIVTHFTVEGVENVTGAFDAIASKSAAMTAKIEADNAKTEVSYKSLAMNVAHLSTAALSLEGTWSRVAEGQMSVAEGALRSIPALVSLGSAIWTIVTAEKARAVAHAIANALEGPTGWAKLAAAAAIGATATALAMQIPSLEKGALVTEPVIALIGESGEPEIVSPESKMREIFRETIRETIVFPRRTESKSVTNYITITVEGSDSEKTARTIVQHIRAAGES